MDDASHLSPRVREMFERQGFARTAGVRVDSCADGRAQVSLTPHEGVTQQHGAAHAACLTLLLDVAGGLASYSLTHPGEDLVSSSIHIHLLRPGVGVRLIARGRVVKHGRTLSVSQTEIHAVQEGREVLVAQGTMTCVVLRSEAGPQPDGERSERGA